MHKQQNLKNEQKYVKTIQFQHPCRKIVRTTSLLFHQAEWWMWFHATNHNRRQTIHHHLGDIHIKEDNIDCLVTPLVLTRDLYAFLREAIIIEQICKYQDPWKIINQSSCGLSLWWIRLPPILEEWCGYNKLYIDYPSKVCKHNDICIATHCNL